jgi:hypothetical protein
MDRVSMDIPSKGTGTADSMDQLSAALGGPEAGPWAALRPDVEARVLSAGAVLFREGDPSDAMYVVVRGELKATVANAQRAEVLIGCIGPGEPVGELPTSRWPPAAETGAPGDASFNASARLNPKWTWIKSMRIQSL